MVSRRPGLAAKPCVSLAPMSAGVHVLVHRQLPKQAAILLHTCDSQPIQPSKKLGIAAWDHSGSNHVSWTSPLAQVGLTTIAAAYKQSMG
jgi:hypothetical protein